MKLRQRDNMGGLYGPLRPAIQLRPHALRVLAAVLMWAGGPAQATEWAGSLRLTAAGGGDSNALRAFACEPPAVSCPGSSSPGASPDGVVTVLAAAEGTARGDRYWASGTYDLGGRKFLLWPSEDTLVQALSVEGGYRLAQPLSVGLLGEAKDRRGAGRTYTDLLSRAFVAFTPDAHVEVRVAAGARRYLFEEPFFYSYGAAEGAVLARYRIDRHHALSGFGDYASRNYNGQATPRPGSESPGQRHDDVLGAGVAYAYRGPFTASLGYAYFEQSSNSYGQRLIRHRLTGTAGARLPWELLAFAQLTVQLTSYPDGVYLSPEQSLTEDDESHNSLSLKLAKPLTERLDLETRFAIYQDALPQNQLTYLRVTGWLGLTFRL